MDGWLWCFLGLLGYWLVIGGGSLRVWNGGVAVALWVLRGYGGYGFVAKIVNRGEWFFMRNFVWSFLV